MSSSAVTKQSSNQVSQPSQRAAVESREQSSKASASAGLNLNVFAALGGVFSSKSKKETAEDGSSVEQREEHAGVKGAGVANANALASANAETHDKAYRAEIEDA